MNAAMAGAANSPGAQAGEGVAQGGLNAGITGLFRDNSLAAFYAYADYTADQEPSLWLPVPVGTEAVSKHMHHVTQSPLGTFVPEYWTCSKWC